MIEKACIKCGRTRAEIDFTSRRNLCKPCNAEYHREYRARNRDKLNRYRRDRYASDASVRKQQRQSTANWKTNNSERYSEYRSAYSKEYYAANREESLERVQKWRDENPDKVKDYSKRYAEENKDALWLKRVLAANPDATIENLSYDGILDRDNQTCYICGSAEDITIDHLVPLCAGGAHTHDNVSACCNRCNGAKGGRDLHELPQELRKTVEGRIADLKSEQ